MSENSRFTQFHGTSETCGATKSICKLKFQTNFICMNIFFYCRYPSRDVDKFIHGLEENHVSPKEQLFDLSPRPASFDARKELKTSLESDLDLEDMFLTSKKVQRMHFCKGKFTHFCSLLHFLIFFSFYSNSKE